MCTYVVVVLWWWSLVIGSGFLGFLFYYFKFSYCFSIHWVGEMVRGEKKKCYMTCDLNHLKLIVCVLCVIFRREIEIVLTLPACGLYV